MSKLLKLMQLGLFIYLVLSLIGCEVEKVTEAQPPSNGFVEDTLYTHKAVKTINDGIVRSNKHFDDMRKLVVSGYQNNLSVFGGIAPMPGNAAWYHNTTSDYWMNGWIATTSIPYSAGHLDSIGVMYVTVPDSLDPWLMTTAPTTAIYNSHVKEYKYMARGMDSSAVTQNIPLDFWYNGNCTYTDVAKLYFNGKLRYNYAKLDSMKVNGAIIKSPLNMMWSINLVSHISTPAGLKKEVNYALDYQFYKTDGTKSSRMISLSLIQADNGVGQLNPRDPNLMADLYDSGVLFAKIYKQATKRFYVLCVDNFSKKYDLPN